MVLFLYVWTTATDLVIRDDMYVIKGGPVENYLNGTLSFADLWRASDSTRFLFHNLLILANLELFSMNNRIFALMIPFCILASVLLIYREYSRSLLPQCSREWIAGSFIVISLLVFNVIQWEGLIFGYALVYQAPIPFYLASFLAMESYVIRGEIRCRTAALILCGVAILLMGMKVGVAFGPALIVTYLCHVMVFRDSLTKDFWRRSLTMAVFLAGFIFIYYYKINHNDYVAQPVFFGREMLADPVGTAKFLLAAFGASLISIDAFFACDFISFEGMIAAGLIIVLLYSLAVALFWQMRMYEKTYLPFFLIVLTCFYVLLMSFRRFGLGIDYGMASRYTYLTVLGLAAICWVFIFALSYSERMSLFLKSAISAALAVILSGVFLTSAVVWQVQPSRKAYLEKLRDIAMRVDTATDDELSWFGERPAQVRASLQLLRQHKLNVYRETRE